MLYRALSLRKATLANYFRSSCALSLGFPPFSCNFKSSLPSTDAKVQWKQKASHERHHLPAMCRILYFFSDGMPILNTKNEKKQVETGVAWLLYVSLKTSPKTRSDYHQLKHLKPFKGDGGSTPKVHIPNPESARAAHALPTLVEKGRKLRCS